METITEILSGQASTTISEHGCSIEQLAVESFNSLPGELTEYDCPKCKNKGQIAKLIDGKDCYLPCECMKVRRYINLQKESGIEGLLKRYTFETYKQNDSWQKEAYQKAQEYLRKGGWFFIGGQVGTGKTHICTAICGELLKKCVEVKYMLWRNEASRLKAKVNDDEYSELLSPLINARVLYIDDFFKGGVTQGDINLAFEIINTRYNKALATIISSEKTLSEILDIDEAIGSRISEMATVLLNIKDKENWRMK